MAANDACKDCRAHTGISGAITDLKRRADGYEKGHLRIWKAVDEVKEKKVSMKLFYILIVVLIAVCGSIFALQMATHASIGALAQSHAVLSEQVKHIVPCGD